MSLEYALVSFLSADATVAALALCGGGFPAAQLPKGFLNPDGSFLSDSPPTWTFLRAGGATEHTLAGERGPRNAIVQIDIFGAKMADCITLGEAIDNALENFYGAYPDTASPPNVTGIISCLLEEEPVDTFDTTARTYKRRLEYRILFS